MRLVWYLTLATLLAGTLGEFGQIPFGLSRSISISEMLLVVGLSTLLIWQVGIKKAIYLPRMFSWLVFFWAFASVGLLSTGVWSGGLYLLRFILYSLCLWLGYSLVASRVIKLSEVKKMVWVVGILLAIGSIYQLIAIPDLSVLSQFGYDPHIYRASSSLLDPNFLGAVLCLVLPIGLLKLSKKLDINWGVGVLFILVIIVLTFSRSAYLAAAVELLVFGYFKWRKALIVLVALIAVVLVFVPRFSERVVGGFRLDTSAAERIESWSKGVEIWKTKPVVGVGFDNIRYYSKKLNLVKVFSSDGGNSGAGVDSSVIFLLATTGVLGLGVFLGMWWLILHCVGKGWERFTFLVALFGLVAGGQFINSWFYPTVMLLVYLWAGALLGRKNDLSTDLGS